MLPKQIVRDSPLSLILLERLPSEFPTEKISRMSLKSHAHGCGRGIGFFPSLAKRFCKFNPHGD